MKTGPIAVVFLVVFCLKIDAQEHFPYEIGDFRYLVDKPEDCPEGYQCNTFEVKCTGSEPARGVVAYAAHTAGKPKGLIMLFKGGEGTTYWTQPPEAYQMAEEFRRRGYDIVQVKWIDSWLLSSPGMDAGIARLAGRPATVIKHVYDEFYVQLEKSAPEGVVTEFCLTGNSGGASQISYALSHYGLDTILDVVVPTGGPPHAALARSMLQRPGEEDYWYDERRRSFIDKGFGFFDNNGPGVRQDTSFAERWDQESVATGGNDYYHPNTRLHFIIGGDDRDMYHVSMDYIYRLFEAGNPDITFQIVPGTPHNILRTEDGKAALFNALVGCRASSVSEERSPRDPLIPTYSDVRYGKHERNVFDFWKAESDAPTPLVVFIHGGGFRNGDKSGALNPENSEYLKRCLENGVSFASINYPFYATTRLDSIMLNAARAIQFFRSKSRRLNIDKDKIAAYGGSAGGGISLWLAVHDDLADRSSEDPVLRESSRLTVAGHLRSQATYDFRRWPEFLDLPEGWTTGVGDDLQLYKIPDGSWYDSTEIVALRKRLDMIGMIDPSDPPVYFENIREGRMDSRGDVLHHPAHAMYLKKIFDQMNIDNALVIKETKEVDRVDMLDFFFRYLLAETDFD
jgi:acetyl esterase